jgi:hypothetical protein
LVEQVDEQLGISFTLVKLAPDSTVNLFDGVILRSEYLAKQQ